MAQRRQSRQRVRDDFDGAWKNMLSEARFASFVAFFLPDIYDLIDWSHSVEFLEQELRAITRKSKRGQKSVDRLVKVWLKDGSEKWVLVHVEIQSQEDPDFPIVCSSTITAQSTCSASEISKRLPSSATRIRPGDRTAMRDLFGRHELRSSFA